jgi:hypothetical protein
MQISGGYECYYELEGGKKYKNKHQVKAKRVKKKVREVTK